MNRVNTTYKQMSDDVKRTTLIHLVRAITDLICAAACIYPLVMLVIVHPTKMDQVAAEWNLVLMFCLTGVFTIELVYRSHMGKLLIMHHVVSLFQGTWAFTASYKTNPYHFKIFVIYIAFVFFQFPFQFALALYKLLAHKKLVVIAMLSFVFVQEILFKIVHQVWVFAYFIIHFSDFGLAQQIIMPPCILLFLASQVQNIYVVAILIQKTYKAYKEEQQYKKVAQSEQLGDPMMDQAATTAIDADH